MSDSSEDTAAVWDILNTELHVPTHTTAPEDELKPLGDDADVDPELVRLPDPPKKERRLTLLVLAVTALASMGMVSSLWRDAAYAFASPREVEVGELRIAPSSAFAPNAYVQAHAMLGAAGAIRYERPFAEDSFRVAPVIGRPDVYVEVRVPAGEESARYVPPVELRGRLVPFDAAGPRHRGLRSAIENRTGTKVPAGAWLLIDGEAPERAKWAVALVLLFLGFGAWNLLAILRIVRPAK